MSVIQELQAAIERVATTVGPSVVGIGRHQRGSGVVIDAGRVLTNAHNLRGETATVTFADGRSAVGRMAGIDLDGDLAVLEVDTAGAAPVAWGGAESVTVGSVVFGAAASPGGGTRVTFGTISAVARAFRGPGGRRIAGSLEHTAPLAAGSSGGPVVDARAKFVGLNTNRLGEGFYLALPADAALRQRIEALGRGEPVARPRLGVSLAPAHVARRLRRSVGLPERDGLLVRGVEDGGPASRAGIVEGDLIVQVAGRPVADADALLEAIAAQPAPYEARIVRGAEELTLTVGGPAAGHAAQA